jgi:hypothetical protein
VAAVLRRELGVEVSTVEGHYGEFTVLVDGDEVASAGALAFLGILPAARTVQALVAAKLEQTLAVTNGES